MLKRSTPFFSSLALGMLALALLTGCAAKSGMPEPAPRNILPASEMPKDLPHYRVQVGDVLDIKLLLNKELDEQVIVRPDGRFSTVIAHDVLAYGRTPAEIQTTLNELYTDHLSNPQVSVIVRTFAPSRFFVLGEVRTPGEYVSVGPNLTLMQALARAGGILPTAETDEILILRRGATEKPQLYRANVDEIYNGFNPDADVRLAAYDVVYVPRSAIVKAGIAWDQYIRTFVSPTISATYRIDNND